MNAQNNNGGMMSGPPLSGPNPFMMPPPNMMNPLITVGTMPPNMNGLPPSPPPPNTMPMPPDPSQFRLPMKNISSPQKSQTDSNDIKNVNENNKNGNNAQPQSTDKPNFQLP